ncbi:hypothetical protein [Clostridium sp. E02]|uniref:hypothetical protein n=1 Tax=Clostridium sp. E02 TaxID=2487134 RepID=UPI000F5416F5|nr:hypothetical protein [Clostridium sp. E02]
MNNEENIQANDLDSRIGDNHIQMMKAALPYMNVPNQRFISYFIKISELRRTVHLFDDEEVATMGICSAGERSTPDSPMDMLNIIKPYANPAEQDLIDLFMNFFQGFKMAGAYSNQVPSSTIPLQAQSETNNRNQNTNRSNNPFGNLPIDQIKNFLPPEQQSRLDTMQLMMSAMQQMN